MPASPFDAAAGDELMMTFLCQDTKRAYDLVANLIHRYRNVMAIGNDGDKRLQAALNELGHVLDALTAEYKARYGEEPEDV
jgi:hypothetical protein